MAEGGDEGQQQPLVGGDKGAAVVMPQENGRPPTQQMPMENGVIASGGLTSTSPLQHRNPPESTTDVEKNVQVTMETFEVPPHVLAFQPPDGGFRALFVMVGSFLCNGIIFGTINSSGVLYAEVNTQLEKAGVTNPGLKTSVMTSSAIGVTFALSMFSGILTDRLGIRLTTFIGGALAAAGMFCSSFYYDRIEVMYFTYGIMFGCGASLAYTPSLVILGHYFKKWMGLVNGFVTAGSSVFTIVMPFLLKYLLKTEGLKVTFQVLAGMMAALMACALIFKPLMPDMPPPKQIYEEKKTCKSRCHSFWSQFINFEIWKNKRYVIWTFAIPSALFGYFVPYVHLVKYVEITLGPDTKPEILLQCIGATSGIGRILFGFIADKSWVNRILLQQISFFSMGTLMMLYSAANVFPVFIAISLGMGLFDGCFISLLGPIAFDIVGPTGASQAIGFLLTLCSIPLTAGPAIAGFLYDNLQSYMVSFLCAGIPPILGALALFSIRCVKPPPQGTPGSPLREPTEKQNNATVATTEEPRETQNLMAALQRGMGRKEDDPEKSPWQQSPPPLGQQEEVLQYDVRRLALLERESSV
ncbi:monocarboxylate transporter 10-like isoform X2 [Oratosquilla oratoria]|uniref:monocarboxylate transporter 10-like isoform X2 n=1 Tax=Oratosquilla oratoria TaxID=337810 RepID=UPI003F771DF4